MAADHAPFGTDVQPDFETVIRSSRRFDVPVYRSLRERLEDHGQTTEFSKQLFEPAGTSSLQQQGYSPWNNYPILPPVKQITHSTNPDKYHNQNDLNIGYQLKKVLEEYDRANFQEIFSKTSQYDRTGSGIVKEEEMRDVFLRCRLPLSGRVMEAIFDRFRISNGQIDYEKLLKFLDRSYEIFNPQNQRGKEILPLAKEGVGGYSDRKRSLDMDTTSSSKMLYQTEIQSSHRGEVPRLDMNNVENHLNRLGPQGNVFSPEGNVFHQTNQIGITIDENREDAHLLLLLVKHFMAENKTINLKALKHAFFQADTSKQGVLPKMQVTDILGKYRFDLEHWLLEALLGRCDLKDNGLISWVALIEFIDRVQPLMCKKLSPRHIRSSVIPSIPRGASLGDYSQRKLDKEIRPFTWPLNEPQVPFINEHVPILPKIEQHQQPQVTQSVNVSPRMYNGTMLPPIRDKIVNVDPWLIPSGPSTNRSQLPMPSKRIDETFRDNSRNAAKDKLIDSKMQTMGTPWLNRYRHLAEALNKTDQDRKGFMDSGIVRRLVNTYNIVFSLGLDMTAVDQHLHNNRYPDGRIPINPLIEEMRGGHIPHSTL